MRSPPHRLIPGAGLARILHMVRLDLGVSQLHHAAEAGRGEAGGDGVGVGALDGGVGREHSLGGLWLQPPTRQHVLAPTSPLQGR